MAAISRYGRILRLLVMAIFCGAAVASAQTSPGEPSPAEGEPRRLSPAQSEAAPVDGPTLFRQAYAKSNAAKTEADYTAIIELCQQGLATPVSEKEKTYAQQLLSWAYNRRGEVLAEAGDEERALADFESSVGLDANRWQAIHNRGVSYAMAGDYQRALADFDRVIQLNPSYAKAHFNRGEIRFDQGDLAAAIADYTQNLRLAPRDAAAYNSRGFAYYSQGNFRNALADYTQAILLDTRNAEAYVNRGDLYAEQGQFSQAMRDYQQAVTIDPKYGRALQSAAWVRATCPVESIRNPELALRLAVEAIDLDGSDDFHYLDTLAAAYAAGGQYEEAEETQAKAIELAEADMAPQAGIDRLKQRLALYVEGRPFIAAARPAATQSGQSTQSRRRPANRRAN